MSRETKYLSESDPSVAKLAHVCKTVVTLRLGAKWTRPVARQKKNGTLHSVIRVSYQAATSACSRTSLRRW